MIIMADNNITDCATVELAIDATDALSGISSMAFSNDGSNYTDWEQFKSSRMWQLTPGIGMKSIFVMVMDHAGNTASAETGIYYAPSIHVSKIDLNPESVKIRCNECINFSARIYDESGTELIGIPVVWSAMDNIGTVDGTGQFRAGNTAGIGKITASCLGKAKSANITVNENRPPTAGTPKIALRTIYINESVQITAMGASDPENDTMEFLIDFGDGNESGWQSVPWSNHTYSIANKYKVRFKVRDNFGAESEWSSSVIVNVLNNQTNPGDQPTDEVPTDDTNPGINDNQPGRFNLILWIVIPVAGIIAIVGILHHRKKKKRENN